MEVINFQSHRRSVLRLKPGINAIIGSSDNGKSALLRAGDALVGNNLEDGDISDFVRDQKEKPTEASEIAFFKGEKEARIIRDKYGVAYTLTGVENPFTGLNQKVPVMVQEFLNLGDVNVQGQFESYFLLDSSPPEVTRVLNEAAGLGIIGPVLSAVRKDRKHAEAEVSSLEKQVKDLEEKKVSFSWIPEFETKVIFSETMEKEIISMGQELSGIQSLEFDLISMERVLLQFDKDKLLKLEDLTEDVTSLNQDIQSLYKTVSDISNLAEELKNCRLRLILVPEINDLWEDINSLEVLYSDVNLLSSAIDDRVLILEGIQDCENILLEAPKIPEIEAKINRVSVLHDSIKTLNSSYSSMVAFYEDFKGITEELSIKGSFERIETLFEDIQEYDRIRIEYEDLSNIHSTFETLNQSLKCIEQEVIDFENQMPENCPLCGNLLKGDLCGI